MQKKHLKETAVSRPAIKHIAFWVSSSLFPLAALLMLFMSDRVSIAAFYLWPLVLLAAIACVVTVALIIGAATNSLRPSLYGMLLGLPLVFVSYQTHVSYKNAQREAQCNEFRAFTELVLDGDPSAIQKGLHQLKYFSQAEAICVLGTNSDSGSLGYLLLDRPYAGRDGTSTYVVPTDKLLQVTDMVLSSNAHVGEKQAAMYSLLQVLLSRNAYDKYPQWLSLWKRTKTNHSGDLIRFDENYVYPHLEYYCSSGSDEYLSMMERKLAAGKPQE